MARRRPLLLLARPLVAVAAAALIAGAAPVRGCGLTVQNKLSTSVTLLTFNGYDTSCDAQYGTFGPIQPGVQNAPIGCLLGDDCKIGTGGLNPGHCPGLAAGCGDYVVFYVCRGTPYVCFDAAPNCDQSYCLGGAAVEEAGAGATPLPPDGGAGGARRRQLRLDELLGFLPVPDRAPTTAAGPPPIAAADASRVARDAELPAAAAASASAAAAHKAPPVPPSESRLRRRRRI
jgi:hypothetical protein